ncbi:hypothetical protein [Fodinicola feengrottensis]|uniref:hypothetical protein n=1 Tax=Fodinicola feengrottensis TaxID=435914 RepID=UPI0036F1A41F
MPASTATHCPYCALQCGLTVRTGGVDPAVEPREFFRPIAADCARKGGRRRNCCPVRPTGCGRR